MHELHECIYTYVTTSHMSHAKHSSHYHAQAYKDSKDQGTSCTKLHFNHKVVHCVQGSILLFIPPSNQVTYYGIYMSCMRCIRRKCSRKVLVRKFRAVYRLKLALRNATPQHHHSPNWENIKARRESNQEHKALWLFGVFCISLSEGWVSPTVICLVFQTWCLGSWLPCIPPPSSKPASFDLYQLFELAKAPGTQHRSQRSPWIKLN